MNKGYRSEYLLMYYLEWYYGEGNVIRQSTSREWGDFHCFGFRHPHFILQEVAECKSCRQKKFYPKPREKKQFSTIQKWCAERGIQFNIYVHYPKQRNWWIYGWKENTLQKKAELTISPTELGVV